MSDKDNGPQIGEKVNYGFLFTNTGRVVGGPNKDGEIEVQECEGLDWWT